MSTLAVLLFGQFTVVLAAAAACLLATTAARPTGILITEELHTDHCPLSFAVSLVIPKIISAHFRLLSGGQPPHTLTMGRVNCSTLLWCGGPALIHVYYSPYLSPTSSSIVI